MAKRKITAAAKRKGLTIVSAHYGWQATPGEMVPGWEIQFGPEADELFGEDEHQDFGSTAEALEWIAALEPLPEQESSDAQ
jgi:hypothetical protein